MRPSVSRAFCRAWSAISRLPARSAAAVSLRASVRSSKIGCAARSTRCLGLLGNTALTPSATPEPRSASTKRSGDHPEVEGSSITVNSAVTPASVTSAGPPPSSHATVIASATTTPIWTASLAALAQCLVATADEYPPEDPLLTEENKWRAIRYGLDAHLHDFSTGESVSARDAARDLVKALRFVSQDFRCETELEGVLGIVEAGTGAEKQRAVFGERNSLEDVVEYLIAATA